MQIARIRNDGNGPVPFFEVGETHHHIGAGGRIVHLGGLVYLLILDGLALLEDDREPPVLRGLGDAGGLDEQLAAVFAVHVEDGHGAVCAHVVRGQLIAQRLDVAVVGPDAQHAKDIATILPQRIADDRVPAPLDVESAAVHIAAQDGLENWIRLVVGQPRRNVVADGSVGTDLCRGSCHAHHVALRVDPLEQHHGPAGRGTDLAQRTRGSIRHRLPGAHADGRNGNGADRLRLVVGCLPCRVMTCIEVEAAVLLHQQARGLHVRFERLHHVVVGDDRGVPAVDAGARGALGHEPGELLADQACGAVRRDPDQQEEDDRADRRRNDRQRSDFVAQRTPTP